VAALAAEGVPVDSMQIAEASNETRGGVRRRCTVSQGRRAELGVCSKIGATMALLPRWVARVYCVGAEATDWNIAGFASS